ncbi:MAG: SPOR domain-containing protein [bacterium]
MPEYIHNRRGDETESFFCRFTFGQFFALLVLEVFTLFFVFYLGARYGRGLLGLDRAPSIAVEEGSSAAEIAQGEEEKPRVSTTADAEVAKMASELVAKAETPELKDRIRKMIDEAQGQKPGRMPEVVGVQRPEPAVKGIDVNEPAAAATQQMQQPPPVERELPPAPPPVAEATTAGPRGREAEGQRETAARESAAENKNVPADTGVIRVKSADNARYSVQVGSYPNAVEAKHSVERWKGKGYPAYLMLADIPDRGRWYRVRIGGFETRDEAARYLKDLSTKEDVEALVVLNEQ